MADIIVSPESQRASTSSPIIQERNNALLSLKTQLEKTSQNAMSMG